MKIYENNVKKGIWIAIPENEKIESIRLNAEIAHLESGCYWDLLNGCYL